MSNVMQKTQQVSVAHLSMIHTIPMVRLKKPLLTLKKKGRDFELLNVEPAYGAAKNKFASNKFLWVSYPQIALIET